MKKVKDGYYWCSVGGNPLEPCFVKDGVAKTIGCPDAFVLNGYAEGFCPLVLYLPCDPKMLRDDSMFREPTPIRPPDLPPWMGGEKPTPGKTHRWFPKQSPQGG